MYILLIENYNHSFSSVIGYYTTLEAAINAVYDVDADSYSRVRTQKLDSFTFRLHHDNGSSNLATIIELQEIK